MQVSFDSPDSLLASFSSSEESGRLIFITGPMGAGKTRWCQEFIDSAACLGVRAGGVLSPAVFQDGMKVAIDLVDLHSNTRRCLAVRKSKETGIRATDNWLFDEKTLKWGNTVLASSWNSQLIIVDELGPLELNRGIGLINVFRLVASRRYKLAIVTMRPALLDPWLKLWHWGQVIAIEPEHQPEVAV